MTKNSLRFLGLLNDKPLVGPRNVNIHLTDVCNLKCIYCWYNFPGSKKRSGKSISFEKIKELIADCKKLGVESICLSGEGEPTLHPNILEIITLIKKNSIRLVLLTNGTWNQNFLKVAHLIDTIRINISAPDKENYKKVHTIDLFNKVIKNILLLYKLRSKKKLVTPSIEIVFILNKLTYPNLKKLNSLSKKIGVNRITLKMMSPIKENKKYAITNEDIPLLKKLLSEIKILNKEFSISNNFNEIYNLISKEDFLKPKSKRTVEYFSNFKDKNIRCYIGYYFAQIDLGGEVTLCCINRRFIIGNINKRSFFEIWNSKEARDFRLKSKYDIDLSSRKWKDCNHCLQWKFLTSLNKRVDQYHNKE